MKKILLLFSFTLFGMLGIAQQRYSISTVQVCWQTAGGLDSVLYKNFYVGVGTSGQPFMKDLGFMNQNAEPVTVTGGTLDFSGCGLSGDTLKMQIVGGSLSGGLDTVIVISYDTCININYDTTIVIINDTTIINCAGGGGGSGLDLDSLIRVEILPGGILELELVSGQILRDTINSLDDQLELWYLRDYQADQRIVDPSDTVLLDNGLQYEPGTFDIGLGGQLVQSTVILALQNNFAINQDGQAYLQTNTNAWSLFPRFPRDSFSFRFWSLADESNRSVVGVSEGAAYMYSRDPAQGYDNGFLALPDRTEIVADDNLYISATNSSALINIDTSMVDIDNSPNYLIAIKDNGDLTRLEKSSLGGGSVSDTLHITQTSHQFTPGQWVSIGTDTSWMLSDANAPGDTLANGASSFAQALVIDSTDANNFIIQVDGIVNRSGHGKQIGRVYYLGNTPGTDTLESPQNSHPLFVPVDGNRMIKLWGYRPASISTPVTTQDSTTARNVGLSGEGIFRDEVGNELQFKKIVAGTNVTFSVSDSTLTINASGGGGGSTTTVVTTDQSLTGTIDTLDGQSFAVTAGNVYRFELWINYQTSSASAGLYSTVMSDSLMMVQYISNHTQTRGAQLTLAANQEQFDPVSVNDDVNFSSSYPNNGKSVNKIEGVIVATTNQTIYFQISAEPSFQAIIYNSVLIVEQL